jgi:hypothetical protein
VTLTLLGSAGLALLVLSGAHEVGIALVVLALVAIAVPTSLALDARWILVQGNEELLLLAIGPARDEGSFLASPIPAHDHGRVWRQLGEARDHQRDAVALGENCLSRDHSVVTSIEQLEERPELEIAKTRHAISARHLPIVAAAHPGPDHTRRQPARIRFGIALSRFQRSPFRVSKRLRA